MQGWVAEWSNAHAWKACLPQGNQGSNPCPSAIGRAVVVALSLVCASALFAEEKTIVEPPSLDLAKRQFEAGKMSEARATLDALDAKTPGDGYAQDLRGSLLLEEGKLDEAARLFTAAAEEKGTLGSLHLGDVRLREKKFSEAREAYRAGVKKTKNLGIFERLRFGMLLTYLGEKSDAEAQEALGQIRFPSESGAYYFAQAAWAYAHGQTRDAEKWIKRSEEISGGKITPWFAARLHEMGWTKTKPSAVAAE